MQGVETSRTSSLALCEQLNDLCVGSTGGEDRPHAHLTVYNWDMGREEGRNHGVTVGLARDVGVDGDLEEQWYLALQGGMDRGSG